MAALKERGRRKIREGVVISDRMNKTRAIRVFRRIRHPLYGKVRTHRSSLYMHDETNESHQGDWVEVMETRPLSRLKRWRLVRILRKAAVSHVEKK
ncbi:MAG: 30S ribosomal protein S17 [Elusimicrobia bacterium]|nr:30S ribosomal protein S17 [Elusimicrobiota bacterium]